MKKITLFIASLLISISAFATTLNGGTTLYLNPGPWNVDGAVFVAYYWGDANGDQWSDFTETSTSGIFQTTVPNGTWTGLKFIRMNPDGNKHDWNNKWNDTDDLTYDGTNNQYTITGWGTSEGSWSTFNGENNNGGENPNPNPTTVIPNGIALYLLPSTEWKDSNARFAAYLFGGDGELWLNLTDSNGDGIYELTTQGTHEKVIFCRMNPETTENNWDNKWNQTADLTYDGTNNQYNVSGWDGGSWTVYQGANNPGEGNDKPNIDPNVESYTLCGDSIIFGTDWDETNTNNDMTKGENNVWTKEYKDITLTKGSYEYKVVANHTWGYAGQYPTDDSNMTLYIPSDNTYCLTFTYNLNTPELKCTYSAPLGVEDIFISQVYSIGGEIFANTEIRIFTITGLDVTNQNGNLEKGIYIVKTAKTTSKIIVK